MSKPRILPVPLAQQAFAFVTDEERIAMSQAYEKQQERKLYAVLRHTRLASITIEVLKRGVFTKKGEELLASLDNTFSPQIEIPFSLNKEPTEQDRQEDADAFMRCLPQLLDCMLQSTLSQLADVGGVDEKIDTLEWVYAGDRKFIGLWVKGVRKSVPLKKIPWTFNWVCAQLGMDPDDLREGIELGLLESQRAARQKIDMGQLQPIREAAYTGAINFINDRSTYECKPNHTRDQAILGR